MKYWDILLILVYFCRFRVIIEMLKPDKPDSATTLKGLDYIDVPGLSKRDYRLNFFAHKEGTFSAKVRSMCLCTRLRSCSMPTPPPSILISLRHLHKPLPLTAFKAWWFASGTINSLWCDYPFQTFISPISLSTDCFNLLQPAGDLP